MSLPGHVNPWKRVISELVALVLVAFVLTGLLAVLQLVFYGRVKW